MTALPIPPARRRAPPPAIPAKPLVTTHDHEIIGGPPAGIGLGRPVFTEGKTLRQWPYVTGSKLVGLVLDEYQQPKTGKPIYYAGVGKLIHTHYWVANPTTKKLVYKGTASSRGRAISLIENSKQAMQPVADSPNEVGQKNSAYMGTPPPRRRSTPKAA